jgi:hypothetical protein
MDFGQVAVGLTHGEQVQVFNVGSAPLNVLGATVDSCVFRGMPITDSDASRSPVPGCRSPIPGRSISPE